MPYNALTLDGLADQGRRIVEYCGGSWNGTSGMCRCPAHDDRSPSLSVRVGARSLLFKCFAGCNTLAVLRALRSGGQIGRVGVRTSGDFGQTSCSTLSAMAQRLWAKSCAISGTVAEAYLARRGINAHGADLRFHPRCQLGSRANASFHPALIAAIRDDCDLVAVHRTFLDAKSGWKAAITNPKRMLGRPGTGAVRLAPAGVTLGLAEGLETALSAADMLGFPVWAVLGNERFGMVSIPKSVRSLIILPDLDTGGQRAAALAQQQARDGLAIEVRLPPRIETGQDTGVDWNDVAMRMRGEAAEDV